MRRLIRNVLAVALIFVAIFGCELDVRTTDNAGINGRDYSEEPISEKSKKYSMALETSNRFIEFLAGGRTADARSLLDLRLGKEVSETQLHSMYDQVVKNFGPYLEHKPMQWGFTTDSELKGIVISTKIVIHRDSEVFYIFNFEADGSYRRIVSFNITPRSANESIADGARRAYGLK